jgi:hypothetical protein
MTEAMVEEICTTVLLIAALATSIIIYWINSKE